MLLGLRAVREQGAPNTAQRPGVDVHTRLYNRFWFNDGFHAAHHRAPAAHWTTLPARAAPGDVVSPLPPILRWAEALPALANRVAAAASTASSARRWVSRRPPLPVVTHTRAWRALLRDGVRHPRGDHHRRRPVPAHGARARPPSAGGPPHDRRRRPRAPRQRARFCPPTAGRASLRRVVFDAGRSIRRRRPRPISSSSRSPSAANGALLRTPPAPLVAVHDWLWRRRGATGTGSRSATETAEPRDPPGRGLGTSRRKGPRASGFGPRASGS